ncbi:hypothetical protein MCUN1_001377 [Malassezia cuniculi]|uniref:Uncharacterized protein n=1 Tax=Malassezia cuniculi TaxID=948313 RepID=A0AAF0EQ55_9BASI|nr:hypothetical protein MCUN1_001377 [Malassezia cuniculi]
MSLLAWATGSEPTPKTVFQTSVDTGIPRLYSERHVPVADHRYWVQYTTLFETEADVANMLTVDVFRKVASEAPENLVNLVEVLVMHMESLVDDPQFAPVPPRTRGGFSALFAPTNVSPLRDGRNRALEVLNCCRIISRVVPVIYETLPQGDEPSLEQQVLWTPRSRVNPKTEERKERTEKGEKSMDDQFTLTDGDESILSVSPGVQALALPDDGVDDRSIRSDVQVTVGHSLLDTLVELLFHSGFTMPWTEEQLNTGATDISRVHFTIWESGIGCPVDLEGTLREHVLHRIEVLRCLLVLLAKPMYVPAAEQYTNTSVALEHVACELERPAVLAFLCSMLNTLANYRQADGWLPESLVGGDVERDAQASMCAQILSVLLTCSSENNLFSFYLAKLYRASDLAFLADGFGKIFASCISRSRGAFQISAAGARTFALPVEEHVSEILPILWVLLRENMQFRKFVVENRQQSLRLVSWLLFVALSNKTEHAAQGQVRLAVLLLQDITSERELCVHLSTSGSGAVLGLPARLLRTQGPLAADVLIEGVYSLLASGEYLAGLHVPLMTTLSNTAPFWRNISVASAARLEQLLARCASPSYLLADEGNPRVLCILLDTFNNVLQHQYAANAQLVYIIVRSHKLFDKLRKFDLDEAVAELQRVRAGSSGSSENITTNKKLASDAELPSIPADAGSAEGQSNAEEEPGTPRAADADSSADTVRADPLTDAAEKAEAQPLDTDEADVADNVAAEVPEHTSEKPLPSKPDIQPIGRSGFIPTHEWVTAWHASLPLAVIDAALSELLPPIEHFCDEAAANNANADECVLAFLREQTLVGVLPPPQPLNLVHVAWNEHGEVWLQSYIWGIVYLVGMRPFDTWTETHTRFFDVHFEEPPQTAASLMMQSVSTIADAVWKLVPGTT